MDTANDFGRMGGKPSHPELHDWLAATFRDEMNGSVKKLHKLIVMSETYRQGSRERSDGAGKTREGSNGVLEYGSDGIGRGDKVLSQTPTTPSLPHSKTSLLPHSTNPWEKDADNQLLWRFPTRRLEAEVIRDSILAVSGQLDLKMYGVGFNLFDQRGGLSGFNPVESPSGEGLRRMIYAHKVRMEKESVFGAFDCPDAGQTMARRRQSTTPIQALNLINSPFTIQVAEACAARVARDAATGDGDRIERQATQAVRLALGRAPTPEELADSVALIRDHSLVALCRLLLNTGDFVTLP